MDKFAYYVGQEVTGTINNVTKTAINLILGSEQSQNEEGEQATEEKGGHKAVIYVNDIEGFPENQNLRDVYHEGEEFTALVKQIGKDRRTEEPLYILSTKLYAQREQFTQFEQFRDSNEIIKGTIKKVHSKGADVYYNDVRLFLPIRNIDVNESALRKMINEEIDVVVTAVNRERLLVVVSNTLAEQIKYQQAKEQALAGLSVGMDVKGQVTKILDFGAIVSLGTVSGLLHKSELAHKRVGKITDVVNVGDEITVKIIRLHDDRIGLSLKALQPHPWDVLKEQYHVGDIFEGTVTKVIPAGLLIALTDEYSGLMPRGEYSWNASDRLDGQIQEGDKITVKVMAIDDERRRISLSHRETVENMWSKIKLHKNDVITVTFVSCEEKGAKVAYEGVYGFMPISEVTGTRRINRADEVFKEGDSIDVVVLDVDPQRAKLVVSAKANEDAKEKENFEKYYKDQANKVPTNTLGDMLGDALKKFEKTKQGK